MTQQNPQSLPDSPGGDSEEEMMRDLKLAAKLMMGKEEEADMSSTLVEKLVLHFARNYLVCIRLPIPAFSWPLC